MDDYQLAPYRETSLTLARDILVDRELSAEFPTAPTTEEIIAEAQKLMRFINHG